MSDTLVINTSESISKTQKYEEIKPLPIYGENFSMLSDDMPLYKDQLPNPYMSNLISKLKMTMKMYNGVGLSANQCGIFERVFIIGTEDFQLVCINPEVIAQSEELEKSNEGCLSFPGLFLKIPRPKSIQVRFLNENGEQKEMWLDGLTARCYLHELDHMNGVKFVEKVGNVSLAQGRRKQGKILKKSIRNYKNGI